MATYSCSCLNGCLQNRAVPHARGWLASRHAPVRVQLGATRGVRYPPSNDPAAGTPREIGLVSERYVTCPLPGCFVVPRVSGGGFRPIRCAHCALDMRIASIHKRKQRANKVVRRFYRTLLFYTRVYFLNTINVDRIPSVGAVCCVENVIFQG